jgi:two-component system NarL family sensor kinase
MTRRSPRTQSDGDPSAANVHWVVARPVAQFAIIGLAAVAIVGLATATASRRVGQREAISDARTTTLVKAQGLVEPVVTDTLASADPAAVAAVGAVVEHQVVDSSLVRVKIWTQAGKIVYSNDHRLEGTTYPLAADDLDALRSGLIKAGVSDLSRPENRDERPFGKLLEVYLPIRSPNGQRLLFEAYYRYAAVSASGRRIWSSFAPVSLGALVVLELLQIPLAWSLAKRLRQRQREREVLLHRALEASGVERRRIASDLHDGVVQDLVGVAFNLAGAARDADLPPGPAGVLESAATSVRSSITALRSTLVDIYPPDLAEHGLRAALADLAGDASSDDRAVTSEVSGLPDELPPAVTALLYRAAREALRNVGSHAGATTAAVRAGADRSKIWLEVSDDGSGFDPGILEARAADGHLGLKGLEGVVRDAGGSFSVDSQPGRGTTVRVEVPVG